MNKQKLLMLFAWMLAVKTYGQTQLRFWDNFQKKINMEGIPIPGPNILTGTQFHAANIITSKNGSYSFHLVKLRHLT